jgi:hypothetical protein
MSKRGGPLATFWEELENEHRKRLNGAVTVAELMGVDYNEVREQGLEILANRPTNSMEVEA